jgi:ArsR family transcriptional regulator, arsenate/arsenite/antimonite-responsive transcriptional repressor
MDIIQFQRIAKALSDPRRFEILEVIAEAGSKLCCGAVVERFPVAQATISHHLKELVDAGLVEARSEGQFKYLSARSDVLEEYTRELRRRLTPSTAKHKRPVREDQRKSSRA